MYLVLHSHMFTEREFEIANQEKIKEDLETKKKLVWITKDLVDILGPEFKVLEILDTKYYFHPDFQELAMTLDDFEHFLYQDDASFRLKEDRNIFEKSLYAAIHIILMYAHALKVYNIEIPHSNMRIDHTRYNGEDSPYMTWLWVDFTKCENSSYTGYFGLNLDNGEVAMQWIILDHSNGSHKTILSKHITDFTKVDKDILEWMKKMFETK